MTNFISGKLMEALKRHQFQKIKVQFKHESAPPVACHAAYTDNKAYLVPNPNESNDFWNLWYHLKGHNVESLLYYCWPLQYEFVDFGINSEGELILYANRD